MSLKPVIEGRQFYRVPHDIERMNVDGDDLRYRADGSRGTPRTVRNELGEPILKAFPEVYRMFPGGPVVLDCTCQRLWKDLNPKLSNKKWATLLGNKLAWTNRTGFPGHYDCINNLETDATFPRYDEPRVCGGAIVTGTVVGDKLWIDSIRNNNIPSLQVVQASPWLWYWGVSVSPDGSVQIITRDGIDGVNYGVIIPQFTDEPVYIPLNELHKLAIGQPLPSATWLS